jgi:hypothetical protein
MKTRRSKECVQSARNHVAQWFRKDTCYKELLDRTKTDSRAAFKFREILGSTLYIYILVCIHVCMYIASGEQRDA